MKIVCLTGWQQPVTALKVIAPNAHHVDYANAPSFDAVEMPPQADTAIGWSLGGLVLLHAVAARKINPAKIMLIAAPFQFVADATIAQAMPLAQFKEVQSGYRAQPKRTVEFLHHLVGQGDTHGKSITATLNASYQQWQHGASWLDFLGAMSCASLDLRAMPPTVILHGEQDAVTHPEQASMFAKHLPQTTLHLLPNCGHAPHLHQSSFVASLL